MVRQRTLRERTSFRYNKRTSSQQCDGKPQFFRYKNSRLQANKLVDGLGEVIRLGKDLQLCNILAKNGRRSINGAKDEIIMGAMFTLAKYKRKKGYQVTLPIFYFDIYRLASRS
jgi:hypothetical protein